METLFLKIIEKLENSAQVFTDLNLAPVKYIDLYRGQPANIERFEYFALPAVFIGYKLTKERIDLDIHVLTDANHDTNNKAPNKLKGLDIIKYNTVIIELLSELETENTGKLVWESLAPVDIDVINYHLLTFSAVYEKILFDGGFTETDVTDTVFDIGGNILKEFS